MTLPELPADAPAPSRWAEEVSRDAPHGLDVLEAHVLAWSRSADELANTSKWGIAWGVSPLLALLASIGGFAAVFGNPRDIAIGRTDAPDAGDIPWAMISYAVAAIGVVLILIRWFVDGRRRNGALLIMLALSFAFGALGVVIAYQLAGEAGIDPGLTMLPAFVMMALAAVVFVLILLSPKREPEPQAPPVPIDALGEKAMKYLLQERNEAIKVLGERRMLPPDVDIDALKARPLGRLHLEEDV